jgi:hypothetical protein
MLQVQPDEQRKRGDEVRKGENLDEKWLAHIEDEWR